MFYASTTQLAKLSSLFLSMVFLVNGAFAQGVIRGSVTDMDGGDPLPGANILILGTQLGASAATDGSYNIAVPAGTYVVQASFIGFSAIRATVTVAEGAVVTQDFQLAEDLIGAGEVVVLGTRNQGRTVVDSPVPIDVLTPDMLATTGMVETVQLLQQLIPSYNAPQASITDGSDHVRPATLRGLGPDQVLVLVNGKRRHTSALVHVNGSVGRGSTGADLNAIPAGMIGKVEVLRDGAAAQYGSDAIAGVINVNLKESKGLDVGVSLGSYLTVAERGYELDEGLLAGESPTDYDWAGNVESVTHTDGEAVQVNVGYGFEVAGGDLYVAAGLQHREHSNRAGLDPRPQYYDGFQDDPAFNPDFTEDSFDRLNHRYGNGEFDDISLFANASFPVGDGAELYAFGGASAREGLTGCFYRRSLDNRTNRSLYPDGFLPKINAKVADISLAGGVKGSFGKWAYDFSETIGTNAFRFDMADSHNASMDNSPTEFDAGTLGFAQATTNFDLFRTFDVGTAAPLSFAVGGEFRFENYTIDAGDMSSYVNGGVAVRDGPNEGASTAAGSQCFPGFQPASEQDETRTNFGIYADLENNVTEQFLVGAAARYENYNDFGGTATFKLAGRYEVNPVFALRGAVSTGFRAPSLAQSWFTSVATNFIDGVPFEVGTFPVDSDVAKALGAQELDPETSINISAGITFQQENASLTADVYQIDIDDRITFTENFTSSAVGEFLQDQGINANGGRFFTNALDTRTQGIDVTGRYATEAGNGTLRFTLAANFNETEVRNKVGDGIPAPSLLQNLGVTNLVGRQRLGDFESAQPKSKVNFQVNYGLEKVRFMARVNRYGEVTAIEADPTRDETFGAKFLTDVEVGYLVQDGINIAVGANNVLDVYPDKQLKRNSFNGIFPYDGFSPFGFFGRYVYTRVSVNI